MENEIKKIIKKEIAPLLIGIRNDLDEYKDKNYYEENEVAGVLIKGEKGEDGYTPEKGKDYPSEEQVFDFIKDNLPKRGKDYFTNTDIENVVKEVVSLIPKPENGKDGVVDYSKVKDIALPLIDKKYKEIKKYIDDISKETIKAIENNKIPEINASQIRNKLEALSGKDRLDAKAIKGLEKFVGLLVAQGGGGGGLSKVITDTSLTGDGTPSNPLSVVNSPEVQSLQNVTDIGATTTNTITVPAVQFNINAGTTATVGGLTWNATDETLDLGMPDNITLQIGQENQLKVRNNTGSTLLNGKPVYTTGMLGNRPTIAYAKGDSESTGRLLGILTQDISNNADGKVTTSGYVRNINTTGTPYGETWADGDRLWVSKTTAGALTKTEPTAPHHSDLVGQVVNAHQTQGSILVSIRPHLTMEELADTNGTALTTSGQIPVWNQTNGYFDFNYNLTNYLTTASASSTYVPYTGATTNLNLGTKTITSGDITSSGNINATGTDKYILFGSGSLAGTQLRLDKNGLQANFEGWYGILGFTADFGTTNQSGYFDVQKLSVGIGSSPSAKAHIQATTEQLRLGYDASNYFSTTVGSTGLVTFDSIGTATGFKFNDSVAYPYVIKSANYTLTSSDKTVECITNGSTQTLPTAIGCAGREYRIINATNSNVIVATTSSQTIGNKATGNPTTITLLPEEWLDVVSNGSNWRII